MSVLRVRVVIECDEVTVHEFSRSSTNDTADGLRALLGATLGWMQAYQGAVGEKQWRADVDAARGVGPRLRLP